MVKRNCHFAKLQSGYLFPEINKRKKAFLERVPNAQLISLGIGDTTEPLPEVIAQEMAREATAMGTLEGYLGYGPEQGYAKLRDAINQTLYSNCAQAFQEDEIFVSDGAKCDIGRLQLLFGAQSKTAVQDPSYPVYIDTSVILGQTGNFNSTTSQYENLMYLNCTPENDFFPNLDKLKAVDLIYFCSPNNPTGAVATHAQLKQLVSYAKKNRSIIIFDAAYAPFIQDTSLPRSIYEVEGAEEVAIELGSFSKMVGFTGVRLAWSVVPKALKFCEGESVHRDWMRINTTFFNGASCIAQAGGLAALSPQGQKEKQLLVNHYMENAQLVKSCLESHAYQVHGGDNAPYLWIKLKKLDSWNAFETLLEKTQLVTTPGCGFGPTGEGFLRLSAFGHRQQIMIACERLNSFLQQEKI